MVQRTFSTRRRGMVLLIVLALLAMVGLTAVTFLLTTGQVKDASDQNRRMGENTIDPDAMLHDAVMQVIRGTEDTTSAISGSSLLEDMYGTTETATTISGTTTDGLEKGMAVISVTAGNDEHAGRVITCVDEKSPAYGKSSVILRVEGTNYYCLPFPDGKGFGDSGGSVEFIVNARPFQGDARDYDAFDDNNRFLARRNVKTGKVDENVYSFRGTKHLGENLKVDADNDGYYDSYWLDLGAPVYTAEDGTQFKPYYGIVVEDMDGRINVNAHGDMRMRNSADIGRGRGPAEVSLYKVFPSGVVDHLYHGRFSASYGYDSSSTPDYTATASIKGGWYQKMSKSITGDNVQRTPYDTLGVISYTIDDDGFPNFTSADSTALPASPQDENTQMGGNGYDLDLGMNHLAGIYSNSGSTVLASSKDMPYSPSELEALIRPFDFDTPFLPSRLKEFLKDGGNTNSEYARLVTTDSWDIPVTQKLGLGEVAPEKVVGELLACWPIDLLRSATFNEYDTWDGTKYPKRQIFMQSLYTVLTHLQIDIGGSGSTIEERRAQWCANVVDFLDADSIMTPFKPDGKDFYVFGCEQPEVLITETVAIHSRNTEMDVKLDDDIYIGGKHGEGPKSAKDTTVYENYPLGQYEYHGQVLEDKYVREIEDNIDKMEEAGWGPDGEQDFDQYVRPQGALFVELYRPGTINAGATTPTVPNDIYASNSQGIDITKLAPDGKSVWRLAVMNNATPSGDSGGANEHNLKRDEVTDKDGFEGNVERFAYLAGNGTNDSDEFYPVVNTNVTLEPGKSVLIGPEGETVFKFTDPGTETDATEETGIAVESSIRLTGMSVTGKGNVSVSGTCIAMQAREDGARFSVTEDGSYGEDNSKNVRDDGSHLRLASELYSDKPMDKDNYKVLGTSLQDRRMIHLQRLADPSRAYNSETNPYITVDSMIVDLTVINARTGQNEDGVTGTNQNVATRKRESISSYMWEQDDEQSSAVVTPGSSVLDCTFLDDTFGGKKASLMWDWLGWINRPPVSPFELMNVTNRCASELLHFYDPEDENTGFAKTYGYLPSFETSASRKLFGYLRVPSPQTVTPMVLNRGNLSDGEDATMTEKLPFAYYSMYREPGKININTVQDHRVLSALLNKDIDQSTFTSKWSVTGLSTSENIFHSMANNADRSILGSTTFRDLLTGVDADSGDPSNRFNLYRLANLTTTRSNVFAVWITMGFFEVNADGTPITPTHELGSAWGNVKRYRAFYLIDRSIPVGFERGKNHNAENVILSKRYLQ